MSVHSEKKNCYSTKQHNYMECHSHPPPSSIYSFTEEDE